MMFINVFLCVSGVPVAVVDWLFMKVTSALVAVRHHQQGASGGQLAGDGVLDSDPLHDAHICDFVHRLFPVENEQRFRFHHVPSVFRFRGRLTHV